MGHSSCCLVQPSPGLAATRSENVTIQRHSSEESPTHTHTLYFARSNLSGAVRCFHGRLSEVGVKDLCNSRWGVVILFTREGCIATGMEEEYHRSTSSGTLSSSEVHTRTPMNISVRKRFTSQRVSSSSLCVIISPFSHAALSQPPFPEVRKPFSPCPADLL